MRAQSVVISSPWTRSCCDVVSVCTRAPDGTLFGRLLILWVASVAQATCAHGKCDRRPLSNMSSFVTEQVVLFCPGKMEPLGPNCKLLNKFVIFFLKKGRPWMNTRLQIRVAAQPLFAFKKKKRKERYMMFSRSSCWKALGNETNVFFSFGIV